MKDFRAPLAGASAGVLFAWFAGGFFVLTFGLSLADGSAHPVVVNLVARAVAAALFGGIVTAIFVIRRRRSGGTQKFLQLKEIMASGRVPDDADAAELVPQLSRRRTALRRSLVASRLIFGTFALLGIFLVAQDPSVVLSWFFTPVFVIFGIVSVVQARRGLRKVGSVLAQLRSEPTTPGDDGAL